MTVLTFPTFDNTCALLEGWDLFDVGGRIQLQRIDCPTEHAPALPYTEPRFKSDAHAVIHVARLAGMGSIYHTLALEMIGALAENLE
jgi:hypothetical protein